MPTDPGVILGIKDNSIDPASVMSMMEFAQKLKVQRQEEQTQNALKSILTNPANLDDKGRPTVNALRLVNSVSPKDGQQMAEHLATMEEHDAQAEHLKSEAFTQKHKLAQDVRDESITAYDAALADGIPESEARKGAQSVYSEGLNGLRKSGVFSSDEADNFPDDFDPIRVRTNSTLYKQQVDEKLKAKKEAADEAKAAATQAERDKKDDADRAERIQHDRAEEAIANRRVNVTVNNQGGGAAPGGQDEINYLAEHYRTLGALPPIGRNGKMAAQRDAVIKRITELDKAEGSGATGDIATGAATKADTAGLVNLGKMRASVAQAEGNASKEANLVLSKLDSGGLPGGPSAFGKWVQESRIGTLNSPEASSFQTAVESLKNEYVKVLSTQGGMSGGQSSDAARREADKYINPYLSKAQIKSNIDTMRKSMGNRTTAINEAYDKTRDRIAKGEKSPAASSDGWKIERVN